MTLDNALFVFSFVMLSSLLLGFSTGLIMSFLPKRY